MKTSRIVARVLHGGTTMGKAAGNVAQLGFYIGMSAPSIVKKWCREVKKEYRAIKAQGGMVTHSNGENTVVVDGRTNEVINGKEVL